MTVYTFVLFLHLVGVMFLFMDFALEWVIQGRVRNSATLEQAQPWLAAGRRVPLLGAIGGIGVFIPGLYLAAHGALWNQAWIQAALTVALVIVVLGAAITRPRMRKLGIAAQDEVPGAAQGTGREESDALKHLRDPLIVFSLRIRVALAFGVVYLMAAKPGLIATLVTMGVALVLGILISVPANSRAGAAAS
jgi:hypothetical protein